MQLELNQENVNKLADEFAQDIENMSSKKWLLPALKSHMSRHFKPDLPFELGEHVNIWFENLTK